MRDTVISRSTLEDGASEAPEEPPNRGTLALSISPLPRSPEAVFAEPAPGDYSLPRNRFLRTTRRTRSFRRAFFPEVADQD